MRLSMKLCIISIATYLLDCFIISPIFVSTGLFVESNPHINMYINIYGIKAFYFVGVVMALFLFVAFNGIEKIGEVYIKNKSKNLPLIVAFIVFEILMALTIALNLYTAYIVYS